MLEFIIPTCRETSFEIKYTCMKKLFIFFLFLFSLSAIKFSFPQKIFSQTCIPVNNSCATNTDCCSGSTCKKIGPSWICLSDNAAISSSLPTAPTTAPTAGSVVYDQKFCDSSGNPTSDQTNKLYTAIGCFPIGDAQTSLVFIFRWALGIGGGIAFLLIILASFQITSSAGNPEKIQAGKELLTSAVAGLIMLIFSYYILKVIGVDLLKLPMTM
jgi:hypothetical protein